MTRLRFSSCFGVVLCLVLVQFLSQQSLDFARFKPPSAPSTTTERLVQEHEYDSTIPYLKALLDHNLHGSFLQQKKFNQKKEQVAQRFAPRLLYTTTTLLCGINRHAIALNDDFAFRHIFKNGGTTVNKQTRSKHMREDDLEGRLLVAAVRDPIDHFLSGWSECGERGHNNLKMTDDRPYDARIKEWLQATKDEAFHGKGKWEGRNCRCAVHSFPQSNFLLTRNATVDPQVTLVGDLHELPGLLNFVGFNFNPSLGAGRNSTESKIKANGFPRKRHLISNETMREICDFVRIDYFLFDFELPEACSTTWLDSDRNYSHTHY